MSLADLVALAQEALLLTVAVSIPIVAATALVSFLVSTLQAATQITDSTIGHLPRFLVVAAVLFAAGPWMGAQIASFAARVFANGT